jgi:flagellar biosynthesis/type III secretory pathway protein FliH
MSLSNSPTTRRSGGRLRVLPAGQAVSAVSTASDGLERISTAVVRERPVVSLPVNVTDGERLQHEFLRGVEQGRKEMSDQLGQEYEEKFGQQRRRLDEFVGALAEQVPRLAGQRERLVVQLAMAIAERVVRHEVHVDPEVVLRQVQEAVRRVHGVERIIVRVHPRDVDLVRSRRADVTAASDAAREVTVEADELVERGGCILESESGTVDAQLVTQLKNMEMALLDQDETGESR